MTVIFRSGEECLFLQHRFLWQNAYDLLGVGSIKANNYLWLCLSWIFPTSGPHLHSLEHLSDKEWSGDIIIETVFAKSTSFSFGLEIANGSPVPRQSLATMPSFCVCLLCPNPWVRFCRRLLITAGTLLKLAIFSQAWRSEDENNWGFSSRLPAASFIYNILFQTPGVVPRRLHSLSSPSRNSRPL